MVSAGDFRNGITFEMDGNVYSIIEFQHVKPGKGAAFVRTKIRNVITGSVVEKTFNPNDKYPTAFIDRKDMQYLYNDGDLYYFMDLESYEQLPINKSCLLYTSGTGLSWCGRAEKGVPGKLRKGDAGGPFLQHVRSVQAENADPSQHL